MPQPITSLRAKHIEEPPSGCVCCIASTSVTASEIAEVIADTRRIGVLTTAYWGVGITFLDADRAPDNMSKVYFGLGGSDANETNVKLRVW